MGKMFQAAQLTHERYLNIDHFCTFFISSKLNFHRPLVCCILCYGRQWKFSLAGIKNIFCRSDLRSKLFHVLVVELETFSPCIHYCYSQKAVIVVQYTNCCGQFYWHFIADTFFKILYLLKLICGNDWQITAFDRIYFVKNHA